MSQHENSQSSSKLPASLTDLYELKYNGDEIFFVPGNCKQPWNCTCEPGDNKRCVYKPHEIKELITKYYRERYEYLTKLTTEQFMKDYGYYD